MIQLRLRKRHTSLFLLGFLLLIALCMALVPAAMAARPKAKLVKIVKAPPSRTLATKAVFRLKRAKATKTACRLDKRRYRPCRVRVQYSRMSPGRHTFRVRARRQGRKTTVVQRRWTVVKDTKLPPPTSKIRFADEFNGTSLDRTHWSPWNSPGHAGNGLRRASAFSVSGGSLAVTAKMVNGVVETGGMSHRQDYKYGRYEFRVRTEVDPTGTMSGIVMTWPKHQRSPQFTENDMYETGPTTHRNEFTTFIHYGNNVTTQELHTHFVDASQWHTVVMDWRKEALKIYRDGQLVWTLTERRAIPDVLHHMSIQLDTRRTRALARPVRMFVDYVRIYE